jgi:hypothetical protein
MADLNKIPHTPDIFHGITGPVIDQKQNEILTELVSRISVSLNNNTAAFNANTTAIRRFQKWEPSIAVELIEKQLKQYKDIMDNSGL